MKFVINITFIYWRHPGKIHAKMASSANDVFAGLFSKSLKTLTDTCTQCSVDFDKDKQAFVADGKKPWKYACVGLIAENDESVHPDDLFLVPVDELYSHHVTLNFEDKENRVS